MSAEPVVVLAVTKMLSGMCTGGISMTSGKWIRPVKEFGTVLLGDLMYADRTVIRPLDIVKFPLVKPRPTPPHVEDWICDFKRVKPQISGRVGQSLWFLEKYSEPEGARQILNAERSLALIEPSSVEAIFVMDTYSGKYEARVQIPELGERPLPVTDIKWRALGRKLLGTDGKLSLAPDHLRNSRSAVSSSRSASAGSMKASTGRWWSGSTRGRTMRRT